MSEPAENVAPTELLRRIVRLARELDGDLRALGPQCDAAVPGLLDEACRQLIHAFEKTRGQCPEYMRGQVRALGIDGNSKDLKVQLGGGIQEAAGWINVDFHPAPLALNARWGLPLPDGSAQLVYSSHMLEHLYFRFEAIPLLQEIHRVLQPGGVLRIVVPDIGICMDAYHRNDENFFEDRKRVWPWAQSCQTPLEHFLEYAGANQYDVSFEGHKYGYDFPTLRAALVQAGFAEVERSTYMASRHPELNLDVLSPFASATTGGDHYSLFAEAVK